VKPGRERVKPGRERFSSLAPAGAIPPCHVQRADWSGVKFTMCSTAPHCGIRGHADEHRAEPALWRCALAAGNRQASGPDQLFPEIRPAEESEGQIMKTAHVPVSRSPRPGFTLPIDASVDETQCVADENRKDGFEISELRSADRHLHFQHHDRNDDGQHAVAESFQSVFCEGCSQKVSLGTGAARIV
jgi:hypothetical protein